MATELIPKPEEIKVAMAPHLRAVRLLKKLLKLSEEKQRLEGEKRKGGEPK